MFASLPNTSLRNIDYYWTNIELSVTLFLYLSLSDSLQAVKDGKRNESTAGYGSPSPATGNNTTANTLMKHHIVAPPPFSHILAWEEVIQEQAAHWPMKIGDS